MRLDNVADKHVNRLLAWTGIMLLAVFTAWKFDYRFELNDDVLIKDILAGVYTGVPEGHNIQMLWPLSAVISCFYRIAGALPWYGLFLCAMQYLSFYLILERTLSCLHSLKSKLLVIGVTVVLVLGLYLEHLVFVHYSLTAALMASAAVYLFYTLPDGLDVRGFLLRSIPSVLLIGTAYMLRPNMMLLLLPFVGAVGIIRWSRETKPFNKENRSKYLTVAAAILLLLGMAFGADKLAYNSPEWRAFETLFANRTELYDFQTIPAYDDHREFYDTIGLSKSGHALLVNYNYGLDLNITEDTVGKVAQYAKGIKDTQLKSRIKTAVKEYVFRSYHQEDSPWNLIVWLVYLVLFLTILMRKNERLIRNFGVALWRLGLLFFVRIVLWMYILINGRCPTRISHSLYMAELCILFAMLSVEYTRKLRDKSFIMLITGCFFLCALMIMLPYRVNGVVQKCAVQERVDSYGQAIDEYCKARQDRFYYIDVYSTIIDGYSFSDKMFDDVDNSYENHDMLGGWSCNSPLYRKKAAVMGIENPADGLLYSDKVYLICELAAPLDWVSAYYEEKGIRVEVVQKDIIDRYYGVYQIREAASAQR